MQEKDIGFNDLSRKIERNSAYMSQYMNKNKPEILTDIEAIRSISVILGVPESELYPSMDAGQNKFRANIIPHNGRSGFDAADVPVITATTIGGIMTVSFADVVPRPENLVGIQGAVAVILPDDDLAPTYRTNDTLYFSNGIPPVGDGCLIERMDGGYLVGLFSSMSTTLVVITDGSGVELEIPRSEVRAIFRERARLRG